MEDEKILALFRSRQEAAIEETQKKYGRYCYTVAFRILKCAEDVAIKDLFDRFLKKLGKTERIIFLRRYWYFCKVEEIATALGKSEGYIKSSLHRTREKLKIFLEKEGIYK